MKLRSGDPAFAPSPRTAADIALILTRLNGGASGVLASGTALLIVTAAVLDSRGQCQQPVTP
jgi:hypothetical protein